MMILKCFSQSGGKGEEEAELILVNGLEKAHQKERQCGTNATLD